MVKDSRKAFVATPSPNMPAISVRATASNILTS